MRWTSLLGALLLLLPAIAMAGEPQRRRIVADIKGESVTLDFLVALPEGFDPVRPHPVFIVFPEDQQDLAEAREALAFWRDAADERGWILISPVAPRGILFHRGAYMVFRPIADHLREILPVQGDGFHLAGGSVGAYSAYQVGMFHNRDVVSLTTWGLTPPFHDRPDGLLMLRSATKLVHIGEDDEFSRKQLEFALQAIEGDPKIETILLPGSEARRDLLDPFETLDRLSALSGDEPAPHPIERSVSETLDLLHDAAARADGETYFSLFAPSAVFFGTDPSERWTLAQFRSFATPRFVEGSGWTYTPTRRFVDFDPERPEIAWFDETLHNDRYGRCRGTGVLRRIDGAWKIQQYNLSIPIPNAITSMIVDQIEQTPVNDVER